MSKAPRPLPAARQVTAQEPPTGTGEATAGAVAAGTAPQGAQHRAVIIGEGGQNAEDGHSGHAETNPGRLVTENPSGAQEA